MAEALLINGQRVLPTRAQELGYTFKYPTARAALEEALR
jgi:NAD dependent epimerase/dehydratase family enzyme